MNIEAHLRSPKTQEEVGWLINEIETQNIASFSVQDLFQNPESKDILAQLHVKSQKIKGTYNLTTQTSRMMSPVKK